MSAEHPVTPASPAPRPAAPNPGSDEALALGCLCAVIDNGHGRTPPYPPDGWVMTVGCPVHMPGDEAPW